MKLNKRYGLAVGLLFILCTATGVASLSSLLPINEAGFVNRFVESTKSIKTGAYLIMFMAMTGASIAVWIYPVIKDHRPGLAMASVVFRGFEGLLLLLTVMFLLPLGTAVTEASNASTLLALREAASSMAALMFCVGAFMYYVAFWQLRVVPRWLSGWGIVAIALHTIANILVFRGAEAFGAVGVILNMPIALQEMVLAVWLIVKGFSPAQEGLTQS